MIRLEDYIKNISDFIEEPIKISPWHLVTNIVPTIKKMLALLGDDFTIKNDMAIHKTAIIEEGAVLKGPLIISENCLVAAHTYLRSGVYIGKNSIVGPGCEVKSSVIFNNAVMAHFNFIGDSIIGNHVNFEAGAIIANHYNERTDKSIFITINGALHKIPPTKFGALAGDHSKIGANAVLSPGTILKPGSIVSRLELIDQTSA
jgi:NDP-sugar pyrophosphorylase family protein